MAEPAAAGSAPLESTAVIVLLAAGAGRRYGSAKQLAMISGEPMVRRAARNAIATSASVIVVTGAEAVAVEAALAGLPLQLVRHAGWRDGMGSSLAAGIRHVQAHFPSASAALLCLADQPMIDSAVLEEMLARHRQAPKRIIAASHAGILGPPVLFPCDCFAELAALSGDQGARALLQREAANVERIALDAGHDVDTPDDLYRLSALLAVRPEQAK